MVQTISGVSDYNLCSSDPDCKSKFDKVFLIALSIILGDFINNQNLASCGDCELKIESIQKITNRRRLGSIIGLQSTDNIELSYSFFMPTTYNFYSQTIKKPEEVVAFINGGPYKVSVTRECQWYSSTYGLSALQQAQCGSTSTEITVFSDDDVSLVVDHGPSILGAVIGGTIGGFAALCLAIAGYYFYSKAKANTNAYVDANAYTNNVQAETLGKKTDNDTQGLDALDLKSKNANAHVDTNFTSSIELVVATDAASPALNPTAPPAAAFSIATVIPVVKSAAASAPPQQQTVSDASESRLHF